MGIVIILLMIILVTQVGANNSPDYAYYAIENILVNCGGPSFTGQNSGRKWDADVDSDKFFFIDETHPPSSVNAMSSDNQFNPSLHDAELAELFSTARVSRSQFTYSFRVTQGPKFVRLHFNPAPYSNNNFTRSSSVFSVLSGNFTLLKDFDASVTADYDRDPQDSTVSREYCINVEAVNDVTRLNITFIPSTSTHPDAYALINGIEVVSMPTFLYYTKSGSPGVKSLGFDDDNFLYQIETTIALETLNRIKVGGQGIGPEGDTGMFRTWDTDDDYLTDGFRPHSLPNCFSSVCILKYSEAVPNYTAPAQVYLSGRSYGGLETSITYNLTWEFEVDSDFDYLVRLHFCETELSIHSAGQILFQIFIADYLAENHFDVFQLAGGNLIPYKRDYVVSMKNNTGINLKKKLNLSIKLQPDPSTQIQIHYHDVRLNGVEIFKISDSNYNLGGLNPEPPLSSPGSGRPTHGRKNTMTMIGIVVGAASSLLVLLSLIVFLIFKRRQKKEEDNKSNTQGSSLPSDLCRCFSITEIKAATRNFDENFVVGVGGFGNVYKGYIDDGLVPVAIKRLKKDSQQGAREFLTEIEMLSQLRHIHLVSLIGYCTDGDEMILVYELMARGTLRDHLYGNSGNPPLSWKQRLEICLGAARGLHYLHTGAKQSIIHRDVKSTNILVDEKWVAKVSDFGLSKVGPTEMSHISTVVKGSIGYLDPEYYKRQRLTQKSDVYSFGVVLLEVLCRRPPLDRTVEKRKVSLVDWVRRCHGEGMIHETVDPLITECITPECLKAFTDMTLKCLVDDGNQRPSMNDVVWTLEFALELQEDYKEMNPSGTHKEEEQAQPLIKQESEQEGFTSSSYVTTTSDSNSSNITMSANVSPPQFPLN